MTEYCAGRWRDLQCSQHTVQICANPQQKEKTVAVHTADWLLTAAHTHTLLCLPDSLFLSGWWHAHSYHDDNHSPGTTKTPNWQWLINYIRKRASSVSIVVARRHLEMLLFSSWAAHLPHASAFFTRTVGALAVFSREGDLQREWKRRKRRQMPLQLHCTFFRL